MDMIDGIIKFFKGRSEQSKEAFVFPDGYRIVETAGGLFQVWYRDRVLRPCNLELLPEYQNGHRFMWVESIDKAQELISKRESLVSMNRIIRTHSGLDRDWETL